MNIKLKSTNEKVGLIENFSFGILNISGYSLLIHTFLMIFYTDVVGLSPASVATLFLVTRVADGLNDPVMGFILDHLPRTKLGRFRGYLLIGTLICSVNFLLLWFGPVWAPSGKLAVAYITYLLIGVTFDMMQIPSGSLLPAITADGKDRAMLSTFKGVAGLASSLFFQTIPAMVFQTMGQGASAYYLIVVASVILTAGSTCVGVAGVRERVEPVSDEKYAFRELFGIITQRPVIITMLLMILFATSAAAATNSSMYYYTYILDERYDVIGIATIVSLISVIPAVLFAGPLVRKLGKKWTMLTVLVINTLGFAIRYINITSIPLIYISTVINGIPATLFNIVTPLIQADNTDYVEYKLGWRAEAAVSSLNSFVIKTSHGVGGAIGGYVLSATGYIANQPQTDRAKSGIIFNILATPIIAYVIGLFVYGFGYNLNQEKLTEVNETLQKRREERDLKEIGARG